MKLSEAIDRLEVGETVWVKATVDRINYEGKYIRARPNTSSVYLDGNDEISLAEPQAEKVEVPDYVAEWFKANKISLESNIAAAFRRIGSDERYTKGSIYEWLNDSSNEPIQTLFKMKNGYTVKLKKNFVCFTEVELRKLLEQYPDASVEMKDSHLEDYPEMKDYSLISTAQTENYIQVKDVRYTLDEFNRIGELLLGRNLTDDQQVVLEWLKKKTDSYPDVGYLVGSLDYFAVTPVGQAWKRLSKAEQFQVLAAFANYGLEDNQ